MPNQFRGDLLALGAVGALAIAGGVRDRRRQAYTWGSRAVPPLSELQQRILRLKNEYGANPEMAIRVIDTSIQAIAGHNPASNGDGGLPGTVLSADSLWPDAVALYRYKVQNKEPGYENRTDGPNLGDYLATVTAMVRENKYKELFDENGQVPDLSREYDGTRYIQWLSREVSRAIKGTRARTSKDRKELAELLNRLIEASGKSEDAIASQLEGSKRETYMMERNRIRAYRRGDVTPTKVNVEGLIKISRASTQDAARARELAGRVGGEEERLASQLTHMTRRFGYVLDWFLARDPNTNDLSFDDAETESERWHNQAKAEANAALVQRARREGKYFDCPDGVASEQGEVLYTFPNGYTSQKLTTWKQFQEEGNIDSGGEGRVGKGGGCLHHCIGEGDSYFRRTRDGLTETHSLRAPGNKPQISITIDMPGRRISQARGLRNRLPGQAMSGYERAQARRAGYGDDVERFLDDEALMLMEYVERLQLDPAANFEYVRARVADIKRREKEAEQRRLRGGGNRRLRMPGPSR